MKWIGFVLACLGLVGCGDGSEKTLFSVWYSESGTETLNLTGGDLNNTFEAKYTISSQDCFYNMTFTGDENSGTFEAISTDHPNNEAFLCSGLVGFHTYTIENGSLQICLQHHEESVCYDRYI